MRRASSCGCRCHIFLRFNVIWLQSYKNFSIPRTISPEKNKDAIEQEPSELVHNWPSVSIFDRRSISVCLSLSKNDCFLSLKKGGRHPCAVATEPPSLGLVQSDLKSDGCEYQDLQSANRISNAYIHCGRIANPPERVLCPARICVICSKNDIVYLTRGTEPERGAFSSSARW